MKVYFIDSNTGLRPRRKQQDWSQAQSKTEKNGGGINMKSYKQGQRIKIIFQNDFHNIHAVGIVKITRIEPEEIFMELNYDTCQRLQRKLCGIKACGCGGFRGKHTVLSTGQKVGIVEWHNRIGYGKGGDASKNPMTLIMSRQN